MRRGRLAIFNKSLRIHEKYPHDFISKTENENSDCGD